MARTGRPLKFKTVKELQAKIDEYFANCDPHIERVKEIETVREKGKIKSQEVVERIVMTKQKPYTVTGLAEWLDTSRETLMEYEERKEFVDTIKKAKDKCHRFAEERLFENNPTGVIFNLKNNWGWKDKFEQDIKHEGGVTLSESQAEQLIRARANRRDTE